MEWINLDYLSWGILGLAWLLIATPVFGASISEDSFTGYGKAMGIGFLVQLFIAVACLLFTAIVWAVIRVIG